jgi:uncharacterized membrane protein
VALTTVLSNDDAISVFIMRSDTAAASTTVVLLVLVSFNDFYYF